MQYPNYEIEQTTQPVHGMIRAIADHEYEITDAERTGSKSLVEQSKRLGQLCKKLTWDLPVHDKKKVANEVKKERPLSSLHAPMLDMIKFRSSPNYIRAAQEKMHKEVVWQLEMEPDSGKQAELVVLGLLSRYAHPQLLAFPALPHHESNTRVDVHYDIGVVTVNPDNQISYHALQVKAACTGRCKVGCTNHCPAASRYGQSIQMVSGCCEVGLQTPLGHQGNPVDEYLIAEYHGIATPTQIKHLDELTDNLLFDMSADLLQRGTRPQTEDGHY